MKMVVYASDGGSGGLRGYIKGFLSECRNYKEICFSVICNADYATYLQGIECENICLVVDDSCKMRIKDLIKGNRLPTSVKKRIDEIDPDIVYYMNSIIHRGSESYFNVVGIHNQLYFDKRQLYRQGISLTTASLLIQRHFSLHSVMTADGVVYDSIQSLKQCRENKFVAKNSVVAYFGVIDEERSNRITGFELSEPIKLIYVSTLFPYKNQVELVKGIAELRKRGYRVELNLVGSGPEDYIAKIKKTIKMENLSESVIFHSWVEHNKIQQMIDDSDVFIYASSIETSGFGLMEGMVRGAVIACNKESCMPEILGDGGVLFDVHNSVNIADALQELIDDESLRRRVSNKAKQISEQYTWKNHTKTIIAGFEKWLINSEK